VDGGVTPAGGTPGGVGGGTSGGASAGGASQDGGANTGVAGGDKVVTDDEEEDSGSDASDSSGSESDRVESGVGWTEGRAPLVDGGPGPVSRTYVSPPSRGTRMAVPQAEDEVFLDASITNRRVAMMRIDQGRWGNLPGFVDILETAANDHVDERLAEVHGDANFGN